MFENIRSIRTALPGQLKLCWRISKINKNSFTWTAEALLEKIGSVRTTEALLGKIGSVRTAEAMLENIRTDLPKQLKLYCRISKINRNSLT